MRVDANVGSDVQVGIDVCVGIDAGEPPGVGVGVGVGMDGTVDVGRLVVGRAVTVICFGAAGWDASNEAAVRDLSRTIIQARISFSATPEQNAFLC